VAWKVPLRIEDADAASDRMRVHPAACGAPSGRQEKAMNRGRFEGSWNHMRDRVKQQWGKLNDDDLDAIDGRMDQLVGRIQNRYGLAREEAERSVREWNDRNLQP
jgi:uncharacterized protein YjbJ (UPF0337 family)